VLKALRRAERCVTLSHVPKIARVAYVFAFVIAGLTVLYAVFGQVVVLPSALIPLLAGIGIMRRRVWSAYGYGLYQLAQLLLILILLSRSAMTVAEAALSVVFQLAIALVFFLAGRSLAAAGGRRGWAWPWIVVSALMTLPFLFVQPFSIPSAGMADTLLIGDRVLVQRFPSRSPERGDVTVFIYPRNRSEVYVKRVIGVPGDHIRIANKIVYRNGVSLHEPYAVHKTDYTDSYRDNFPSEPTGPYADAARDMLQNHVVNGEVVVPQGACFVLGDNRDDSLDSRYWGFVSFHNLIGKPLLVYYSEDQSSADVLNKTIVGPHRVRWDRLFRRL